MSTDVLHHRAAAWALISLLSGSAPALATNLDDVLGTWTLSSEVADLVPGNCRTLQFRFDRSTATLTSGQMVLTTRHEVQSAAQVLLLSQVVVAYNGLPDCSGRVLPYAVGQRIGNLSLDQRDNCLRISLPWRRGERYVEFVRVGKQACSD